MKIQASAEDYLEAILVLQERGKVRAIDIANHMSFSKPTISIKMKQFRDNGYITLEADRTIHLTDKGAEIATRIHERHNLLVKVLTAIGVNESQAREDACKIEHNISETTFECIKKFYDGLKFPEQ
ncbi:MAG: metal-dependent transcriptional regulator [Defluviitaleaceae bacterium]|nr:metal-dependent transcriptional regulator [Defluviitaleaceae bacterium]